MYSRHIKIDYTQIPPADLKNLCRALVADIKKFYEDPQNLKDFERWQRERKLPKETPRTPDAA